MSAASERLAELRAQQAPVSPAQARLDELRAIQAAPAAPVEEPGFLESITGTQRTAALPEDIQQLPELGSITSPVTTGEFGSDIQIAAGLLTSFNPEARKDIIKNAVPGVTFEEINDTTVVNLPNGQRAVLNAPGLSQSDLITGIGQALSFVPAGLISSIPRHLAQRIGLGAVTSGATEAGLQATSQALGSEQAIDKGQVATAAALGGAGEVVAPAIQAMRQARINRQAAQQAAKDDLAREGIEAAEETGIDLFPAQITENASELEKQSFIGTLPAGAKRANDALAKQNEQAEQAVLETLSSIAAPTAVIRGERRIRSAAEEAIEAKKTIREERASPLYDKASKENSDVNIEPIIGLINNKLGNLPAGSKSAKELEKVKKLINQSTITRKTTQTGIITPKIEKIPKLRKLHQTKLEIDDLLNKFGENALGRTAKRHVKDIQVSLLNQMDEASDFYKSAREEFAAFSPAVNELEDSIIGKIAGLDDTQLKSVSGKLFDAAETNPETVKQARKAIVDVDPEAWDDIVRVELEKRMGKVKADISDAAATENVPGQLFNAIFGNTKQRRILFNAIDPKSTQGKNLRFLEQALKRASKGRPGGSQTATREEIKKELRGGPVNWVSNFFSPLQAAKGGAREFGFDKRVRVLSDALFDAEWRPQMKKIIKLDPNGNASQRAMLQLLNDIEGQED